MQVGNECHQPVIMSVSLLYPYMEFFVRHLSEQHYDVGEHASSIYGDIGQMLLGWFWAIHSL